MIRPARGRVLVKPVETHDTIPGGRIILTQNARADFARYQMEVVDVGEPEICEDEDCDRFHWSERSGDEIRNIHPIDERVLPGAWCIVKPRSLFDAGHETERLYFVRQTDVLGVLTVTGQPAGRQQPGSPDDTSERADAAS